MTVSFRKPLSSSAKRKILAIWLIGGILATMVTIVSFGIAGFRVNLTPSEPIGLWRIISLDRAVRNGDLIFACPPDTDVMREAHARGYLRHGLCAGGLAPLIKTVAAMPGQVVAIGDEVHIDGRPLPNSQLALKDAHGRPIVPHRGGIVAPSDVYLHSNFPGSFDSRYFGPLPIENVLGLAEEVWTFAP
ncbi:conjugative transfer signal peptidase TraF [Mesorhizobium sp. SB112]|uniref:conjugative transfer signal peptidase TraF n=1 Tax=Mesorhizobium sp. SB112 TaxID=3151853 RepID=UPI0032676534